MSSPPCPRRRFLEVVAQGGVLAGAACLGVGCGISLSGTYAAGNVSQIQVGSLQAISSGPLAIGRDAMGVYAMTLICTHQGCDMATDGTVTSQGVSCNCHGSQFDVNGNRLAGPAQLPLDHYPVTIDSTGAMTINTDAPVVETTRTAVPA